MCHASEDVHDRARCTLVRPLILNGSNSLGMQSRSRQLVSTRTRHTTVELYEGESIIIRNAVPFVCLLAALSFSLSSLGVVSFLSLLHKFEVARSVPLLQP
jgi:hypothetical protein